jgi:hypothetical protein
VIGVKVTEEDGVEVVETNVALQLATAGKEPEQPTTVSFMEREPPWR